MISPLSIRVVLVAVLVVFSISVDAHAKDPEIPASLDFYRREAALRRFEFSPYGGDYLGDKLNHSFIAGGNVQYNLTPMFNLSADFGYSKASADRTSALGASFADTNQYLIDGGLVVTLPAVYRSGKGMTEADFFTSVGVGLTRINAANHLSGYLGGGMKIRPKIPWLAIRVEIRNYFTSLNNPGGSDFESGLSIRLGPTFLW